MPTIDKEINKQRQGRAAANRYKGNKPNLRVTERVKTQNDFEHTKDVMDFFIESSWFQDQSTLNSGNYRDMYILYDAYNTFIPEEYFHYVTNPYNSSNREASSFPSRIRPYSIIRPNIDLLLGEFDKRPFNYTVVCTDSETVNKAEQEIYKAVIMSLEQMFINELNQQGAPTNMESEPPEPPAEIKAKKLSNFKDQRAVMGQNILDRAFHELSLTEKSRRMFKDFLIAGEMYAWRGVENGDMYYDHVSPVDVDYDKPPESEFAEDGGWAVRRIYMTPTDIVTKFWDEITPDEIDSVEEMDGTLPFSSTYFNTLFGNTYRTEEDLKRTKVPVYHVAWKYYKKVGILRYVDEMGMPQEMEVPYNYKKQSPDEQLEFFWIPEWWEGYRVDTEDGGDEGEDRLRGSIYLHIRAIPNQRSMINNFAYCKGPLNGIRYSDTHSRNISIVELGMPYQVMYQILHYKMELTVAKNKGKIALLDINTIPNKNGMDTDKFFYYAEAMGFALIDRNQLGSDKSWNQYQVLDLDLFQHITNIISIMEFVKQEWDELVGITRQRKGQVAASETATGTNTARYQSAIISERIFSRFEQFWRRELQAIIDYSKFSNLASKKQPFYGDDMRLQLINGLNSEDYMESELGIYVSNSSKDVEDLTMLKQIIPQMSTQNTPPSEMIEMIQSRNISQLKEVLKEREVREMEMAQSQQKSAEEVEKRKMEIQKEYKAIEFEFEAAMENLKHEHNKELEHIKGQYDLADTNQPGDINTLSPLDVEKANLDREKLMSERQTKEKELQLKEKEIDSKERIANKQADTQLKVAKENQSAAEIKRDKSSKG